MLTSLLCYAQSRMPELPVMQRVAKEWREDIAHWVRVNAPKVVIILIVTGILMALLRTVTSELRNYSHRTDLPSGIRSQQLRTLAGIINSVGTFVLVFFALMQILPTVGVNIGPLLASAGIAGLAIGFGAQTLVKDIINGFFILFENQYDVGDVVKVAGVSGSVEELTLRHTILRDQSGTLHFIPNSQVTIVSNMTRDWAQIALNVTVEYNEDSSRVIALLKQVAVELKNDADYRDVIVADPEVPGIDKISAGEVDYLMLMKTTPGKQWMVGRELRRRIKDALAKNGIRTAAPRVFTFDPQTSSQQEVAAEPVRTPEA